MSATEVAMERAAYMMAKAAHDSEADGWLFDQLTPALQAVYMRRQRAALAALLADRGERECEVCHGAGVKRTWTDAELATAMESHRAAAYMDVPCPAGCVDGRVRGALDVLLADGES